MNTKTQNILFVAVAIAGIVAIFWDKIKVFFKTRNCGSVAQWALIIVSKRGIIEQKYGSIPPPITPPPITPPPVVPPSVNLKSKFVFISKQQPGSMGGPTSGQPAAVTSEMLAYADAETKRYAQYFSSASCVTQVKAPQFDEKKGVIFKGPADVLKEIEMKLYNENPGHGPYGTFHVMPCPDNMCT